MEEIGDIVRPTIVRRIRLVRRFIVRLGIIREIRGIVLL
jgi:hypothetical protein